MDDRLKALQEKKRALIDQWKRETKGMGDLAPAYIDWLESSLVSAQANIADLLFEVVRGFTVYSEYLLEDDCERPEIYTDGVELPALTAKDYIAHYSYKDGKWTKDDA